MAEKKGSPKEYDRWDKTCVKVIKKPSQNQKKGSKKK